MPGALLESYFANFKSLMGMNCRFALLIFIVCRTSLNVVIAQGSIGFNQIKSVSSWDGQFEIIRSVSDATNGIAFGLRSNGYDVYDLSHQFPHQIGGRTFSYQGYPLTIREISFFDNSILLTESFWATGEVIVYQGTAQEETKFPIIEFAMESDSIYQVGSHEKYTNLIGQENTFEGKGVMAHFTEYDQSYILTTDLEVIALNGLTSSRLITYLVGEPGLTFPKYGDFHQFITGDVKYIGESYYAIKEADYIHIFDFSDPEVPVLVYQFDAIEGSTSQVVDFDVFVEGHYDEVNNFLGDAVLVLLTTGSEKGIKKAHIKMKTLTQDMEATIVQSISLEGESLQLFRSKFDSYDGYLVQPFMGEGTYTLIKSEYAGVNNPETFEVEAQGRFLTSSCGGYINFFDGVNVIYESACSEEIENGPVFHVYNITITESEHVEIDYTNQNLQLYTDPDFLTDEIVTFSLPDLVSQHVFDHENTVYEMRALDGFLIGEDTWSLWFYNGWKLDMSLVEIGSQDIRMELEMSDGIRSALIEFDISNDALMSSIDDINQAPVLEDQSFSVVEFPANGTKVGTVQAFDPNGDTLIFSIIGGNRIGTFSIEGGSGEIFVRDSTQLSLLIQSQFHLSVRASDGSFFTDAIVEINVIEIGTAQNRPPIVLDQEFYIDENSLSGTLIGQIEASDPDGDLLTYAILQGIPADLVHLDSFTGELSVESTDWLDFEQQPNFNFEVEVSDGRGEASSANIVIHINDLFEKTTRVDHIAETIKIYPNPTTQGIQLEVPVDFISKSKSSWRLMDISGQVLAEGQIKEEHFGLSLPKPGVWFLQLTNGVKNETFRLIRQ